MIDDRQKQTLASSPRPAEARARGPSGAGRAGSRTFRDDLQTLRDSVLQRLESIEVMARRRLSAPTAETSRLEQSLKQKIEELERERSRIRGGLEEKESTLPALDDRARERPAIADGGMGTTRTRANRRHRARGRSCLAGPSLQTVRTRCSARNAYPRAATRNHRRMLIPPILLATASSANSRPFAATSGERLTHAVPPDKSEKRTRPRCPRTTSSNKKAPRRKKPPDRLTPRAWPAPDLPPAAAWLLASSVGLLPEESILRIRSRAAKSEMLTSLALPHRAGGTRIFTGWPSA